MRISIQAAICFCIFNLAAFANSEEPIRTANDLLRRVATARNELIQFAARVEVIGPLATVDTCFPFLPNSKNMGLDLEYSRVGQHFVTTVQFGPGLWGYIGRSDNLLFEGDSIDGIFVSRSRGHDFGSRHSNELVVFDPRIVGLINTKQLAAGVSFERAMSELLRSDLTDTELYNEQDLWAVRWRSVDLSITFDAGKNFWPVRSEFVDRDAGIRERWEIQLAKSHSTILPASAKFISETAVNKTHKSTETEFKFAWKMINGYLSTGNDGIQRIAKVHDTELIQQE